MPFCAVSTTRSTTATRSAARDALRVSWRQRAWPLLVFLAGAALPAQIPDLDPILYGDALAWREIGPYRGGRVAAVCGIRGDRDTYWMGSTGGGVWRTADRGQSWQNMSDGFFGGSIGAVAVAPSDPNVVWVGTGEKTLRGNMSSGDGLWRSTDAGRSWRHLGLKGSRHIARVRVHPRDPDTAWIAVLGNAFGSSPERGVFRTRDGGQSFERVLFVNPDAGCVDLAVDPTNPRILYAAFWRVRRTPYSLESGGQGSGIWKSTDSGDTWECLNDRPGFPKGVIGICGISVSAQDPDNIYAAIEAEAGGIFRSRDGGQTFRRVNEDRELRQRAWYYTRLEADPKDPETVYVLNVSFWRSRDGGRTFAAIDAPHSDHHDLWIDPEDPERMVEGNDGGANVSFDGGRSWSTQANQPTAQMYRVALDDAFPFRLLGGQQDNTALRIRSRSLDRPVIGEADFEPTAGGESGHIAPKPGMPDLVVGGSYGGFLTLLHHGTRARRAIHIWPEDPIGSAASANRYRFQWNFPLHWSRHDPNRLYAAANVLFASDDVGHSWVALGGDLTRNDPRTHGPSGGPITKDNTSVEYYGTIFAFAESASDPNVLWTGSDDGLLHLSKDRGQSFVEVTPQDLPEWSQINSIEAHPTITGGLYLAATRYKSNDFEPSLWRTLDFGATWTRIDAGIPRDEFTRVVRADPVRKGLLFAGTERGVWVSFDDGASWRPFRLGLPITPVTDLALRDQSLIAATQGRGYWMFDDLQVLREAQPKSERSFRLLPVPPTHRIAVSRADSRGRAGTNPHAGVQFLYWLEQDLGAGDSLELSLFLPDGTLIRRYTHESDQAAPAHSGEGRRNALPMKQGLRRFSWNLRAPGPESFDGMVLWNGGRGGPMVPPGTYRAELALVRSKERTVSEVTFEVLPDPRSENSTVHIAEQYEFLCALRDEISELHGNLRTVRDLRSQIDALVARRPLEEESLREPLKAVRAAIAAVEEGLYQTKNRSSQDPLNFPIGLTDKLSGVYNLAGVGDHRPTAAMREVREVLLQAAIGPKAEFVALIEEKLPALNAALRAENLPVLLPRID